MTNLDRLLKLYDLDWCNDWQQVVTGLQAIECHWLVADQIKACIDKMPDAPCSATTHFSMACAMLSATESAADKLAFVYATCCLSPEQIESLQQTYRDATNA